MSIEARRVLVAFMLLGLVSITCTVQASTRDVEPTLTSDQIADTAVARALTAQAGAATSTEAPAPTLTPSSAPIQAQCNASVYANTDANVRSGPDTLYNVVGYLPTGGQAALAGRNDAGTWWYIQFAGGPGGYGWVSGTVVTASCLPPVVQVVAAPPLPTAPPTGVPTATTVYSLAPFVVPPMELHILPSPTPVFSIPPFDFELPSLPWP